MSYYRRLPTGWRRQRIRCLMAGWGAGAWGRDVGEDAEDASCRRVADFEWASLRLNDGERTVRSFSRAQLAKLKLRQGDLLLEKSGGGEKTPVGRVIGYRTEGTAVTSNFVARVRPSSRVANRFLLYLLASQYMSGFSHQFIKQNTGIQNLDDAAWFASEAWLPDLDTQKAIADFLDRETARIDQLIEKKGHFFRITSVRLEALVSEALTLADNEWVRFEQLAEQVQRPVQLSNHHELVRLGLYNRGRGIFKKPAADEEGMGASNFFFVRDGDLILSGQFAWEGAVAMAAAEEDGCVVSHRYPVYRGRIVQTSYLLAIFRSSYGDFVLNDASRGSAGRNRPLNIRRLGKERLPIPPAGLQEAIETALRFERELRRRHGASINRLREYRAALITAAVTGQIDVASYGSRGTTDRIEAEMDA